MRGFYSPQSVPSPSSCGERIDLFLLYQLVAELGQAGLSVRSIEKVEFSMKTEFPEPPKWMGEERIGLPWDWMAVAEKTSPM